MRKDNNSQKNESNKDLNDLLPLTLISDLEIENQSDSSFEDINSEIVDNLAYHPKPSQFPSPPIQKPRLFSDSPTFPLKYQHLKIDEPQNYINTQTYQTYPFNGAYPFPKNCGNIFQCLFPPAILNNNSNSFNYYGINMNNRKKSNSHNNSFKIKNRKQGNYINYNNQFLQATTQKKPKYIKYGKNCFLYPENSEIDDFSHYLSSLPCQPYEYICTQKGAKEIQKNLSKFHSECKTFLINVLSSYLPIIMTNIYGNYFVQEFIKTCNDSQIIRILNYISPNFVEIAQDYSGTHVLQAILDKVQNNIVEEQLILKSIIGQEVSMAFNSNATPVLQKIITTVPEERRQNLNEILFQNLKCCRC